MDHDPCPETRTRELVGTVQTDRLCKEHSVCSICGALSIHSVGLILKSPFIEHLSYTKGIHKLNTVSPAVPSTTQWCAC